MRTEARGEETLGRVRRFSAEDMQKVLEIEAEAFPKTAYPKELLLVYASRLSGSFLIFEAEAEVVAYIIYDPRGHIISMAVKRSHRRKGVGRELLRHAIEKVEKPWLEVRSRNTNAIKFYEKMGMRAVGKVVDYYDDDDALLMALVDKRETGE